MGRRRRVYGGAAAAVLQPVAPVPPTQVAPPPAGTPAVKAETAPASKATVKPEGPSAASAPPVVPIVIDDDGDAVIDLTGADAAGPSSAAAAVRTSFGTPAGSAGPSYAASSSSGGGGASSASGGGGGGASSSSTASLFPGLAQLGWSNSLGWGSTTGRPAITPPPWTPPTEAVKGNAGEPPIKRAKTEGEVGAGLDPNGDGDVCIGQFISTLKGMQYYRGKISNGEMVVLDREPTNPYDSNAIRASNVAHAQVGHVAREHAAALAPLLDRNQITIEGVIMGFGSADRFQTSVIIRIFARPELRKTVVDHMASRYVQLRPYSDPLATKTPINPTTPAPQYDRVTGVEIAIGKDNLDAIYKQQEEMLESIVPLDGPPGMLSKLLHYQRKGLGWLVAHEEQPQPEESKPVYFWTFNPRSRLYTHALTHSSVETMPVLPRGGILADEMGLGKTLQMIALVLRDVLSIRANPALLPAGVCATTLILCPLSVMGNWIKQIKTHVQEGLLSMYIYHGASRNANTAFLTKHDIVITTYQTVSFALDKQTETLQIFNKIKFRRVILDEGHVIRNFGSKQAKAACLLKAERRWVISGTPVQNTLNDLYSLVKFIGIPPLNDHAYWQSVFARPLKRGDEAVYKNLRVRHGGRKRRDKCAAISNGHVFLPLLLPVPMFIQSISLRRIKSMQFEGKPLITLPEKTITLHTVTLTADEQKVYDALATEAREKIEGFIEEGTLLKYFMNVLALLSGLRQACDHISLVGSNGVVDFRDNVALKNSGLDQRSRELLQILTLSANEDCAICLEVMKGPAVTPCAHVFCKACIEAVLKATPVCPMCRQAVEPAALFEAPDVPAEDADDEDENGGNDRDEDGMLVKPAQVVNPSSKIIALLEYLENARKRDPKIKSIVFSQWTRMLDLIDSALQSSNFQSCRLDGTMSRKNRDRAIETLETDPNVTVMLVSLTCGNLGLNLVAACQVFVMDPWWNPATEEQAIDRVHRLGQTRPVTVVRFVVDKSVEARVLEQQARKKELIRQTFSGSNNAKEVQLQRLKDIRSLFR